MDRLAKWPDDDCQWVIVYNMQSLVTPIRHVVRIEDGVPYFEDEFKAWYYNTYRNLEGDQFIHIVSTRKMREKEIELIKEYDDMMTKEERKKNWKDYCESNKKKDEEC